jgi:hypothetical protein
MSLRSQTHRTLIGAAGAAALAVGAIASPALAAGSTASVSYTCSTPLGDAHPSAVYTVKSAAAKMAVGQPVGTKAKITLDAGTTLLAQGLGWSKFSGTINTTPSAKKAGLKLKVAKTTLGNGAGGTTVANAKGSTLTGTKIGKFTFKLGALGDVVLTGYDASGKKLSPPVEFPTKGSFGKCKNDAGTTTLKSGATAVTTKVVKDSTKTKESASYSSKKNKANGTAKVKAKYGTAATGKVKFLLKKGSTTVKSAKSKLNKKGIAKVSFKGVTAKGKYSIVGKYAGSKTLKGSSGKASFTVK